MRKDIEIHINTGDIQLVNTSKFIERIFRWVENPNGLSRYIWGEIELPASIPESKIIENGLLVSIPYTPKYREFYIRVKRMYDTESFTYMQNPTDGTEWFLVKSGINGGELSNVFASQLITIHNDSYFIKLIGGVARLFSGEISDFNIVKANRQNANMMLKCIPTNNYRYPLTGVGLVQFVNSNINYSRLSEVLQREFRADGVGVKNASYDFETKDLHLDLDTSSVDNNGSI